MSKSTNRIVLPSHNTGVAPGNETIDAASIAVPGATSVRGDTAAAIAAIGLPPNDASSPTSEPLSAVPGLVAAAPIAGLAVTASADNDVMALIRGRSDAAAQPVVVSPQPVAASPSPTLPPSPSLDANLDTRLRVVETFAFSLDSKLSTHRQNIDDSLRVSFASMRDHVNRIEAQIAALPTTKPHDHSQDIAALRASLSAVAAAHGIVVETPTIKMKQRRFLTSPATVEGGYVVLYYNPRPEENPEIQVRANQPRMVWTGYSFTIPDGYVADIWSAGRCVASFAGSTGDGDFRIPVLGTSDAGMAVSTGREVARLTLRRIEPVAVAVDRGGFGG